MNNNPSSVGITLRLLMPCAIGEVRSATQAVRSFLEEQGLHPDERTACELALAEACNNAVENVSDSARHEPIEIRVFCNSSLVEFQVMDHTPGFDWPEHAALPDPRSDRGRGLFIIRSQMDTAGYLRGVKTNILQMSKRRFYQAHRISPAAFASFKETRLKLAECQQTISNMAKELCFRSETLAVMFRCTAELGRTHDLSGFSHRLLSDLLMITGAHWFVLRLVPREERQLVAFVSSGLKMTLHPQPVPLPNEPAPAVESLAAATGKDVWFDARRPLAQDDPLSLAKPDSQGLVHPLFFGETLIGTLAVGRKSSGAQFSLEQIEVIHTFAEFLGIQVVNTRLQEERVQLRLVSHELEIARNIQRALLPRSLPESPGFELAAFFQSARQVGGDFYDVIPVSDSRLWIVVADVMGKGVPAAMFAAILRTLVSAILHWVGQPSELLTQLNRSLFDELSRVDMFITAQLVLLDLKEHRLTAAGAGHCPILLATPGREETRAIVTDGPPLGVFLNATYPDTTLTLEAGFRSLFYTDGVTDARDANGETFGQQRLMSWLQGTAARPATAEMLKDELVTELAAFRSPARLQDDQTFLILAENHNS
ncbi:MAG: SpoIIE family protein phosphatase [Verrucomicrobia bacterium]|nr:SpoIIE family protein phosphatase [Verrucomicrobiota bacterium]